MTVEKFETLCARAWINHPRLFEGVGVERALVHMIVKPSKQFVHLFTGEWVNVVKDHTLMLRLDKQHKASQSEKAHVDKTNKPCTRLADALFVAF